MNEGNQKVSVEAIYRNLMFIWFTLFTSQFIFLIVLYVAEPSVFKFSLRNPILDQNAVLIIIFAVAAVLNIFLSFVLSKKFLNESVEKQNVGLVQTAMIVGCALCEVSSLLGMMLVFVAQYQYFFLWFILGLLGMLFHFPRRENLINATYKN